MSERFLVTGAYGCIGAWIVAALVREGVEVIGADAGDNDRRVRALLPDDELARATFVNADISDPDAVDALFARGPTHVIHLAALQVPFCRATPVLGARVNVVGTTALFAAAAASGLQTPLVFASSVAAFAEGEGGVGAVLDPGGQPDTLYGVFKFANEGTARVFARESGVNSIGLRPFVVYGPGRDQGMTASATLAMAAAARGEGYEIPFCGRSEMQYAPDVAAAFIAAARAPFTGSTVLNVPGTSALMEEIVAEIEHAAPTARGRITITGEPLPFPAELDSRAFAAVVGDVSVTSLRDGVAATVAHFRSAPAAPEQQ
jgi:UDP-glucuronate 4-epimerase